MIDKAPVLRPEHLVSRRTLARKSKDELIEFALVLMDDVQGEADNGQWWQRRAQEHQEIAQTIQRAAQKTIDGLERTVRRRNAQVLALSDALAEKPPMSRATIAPVAYGVFAEKGLADA